MKGPEICIICVWYEPNFKIISKWLSFANDRYTLIIIDNSVESKIEDKINKNIIYVCLNENKGIAYAQNVGIDIARRISCEYIIFFDQDSCISEDLVDGLKNDLVYLNLRDINVGAIGPRIFDSKTKIEYKSTINKKDGFSNVGSIISSGTLAKTSIFDEVGVMEEKLFIDYVDQEWCWRTINKGYAIFVSNNRILPHSIGEFQKKIFNRPFIVSSPVRYYYKYRNYIWLLTRNYVPSKWKLNKGLRLLLEIFIIPAISKNKISVLSNIFKGIKDGFKR